jgi:hypothetical protein
MSRYLEWHLPEGYQEATEVGAVYRMDGSYQPRATWLYSKGAPDLRPAIVDINKNGVSFYGNAFNRPRLYNETSQYQHLVPLPALAEGDLVSLDVDQKGDGSGPLTVVLELDEG